jgi:hypothetical protein
MQSIQILCIVKPNPISSHEHITHVGTSISNALIPVEQVIRNIKTRVAKYFVRDAQGNTADVLVVPMTMRRREHIRTVRDGKYTDNLLSLNQCIIKG